MFLKFALSTTLLLGLTLLCTAQETPSAQPVELDVLNASIGVWDARIEVWPEGPDSPSISFTGVETNRPYGDYWIASDFDSDFRGQTMKVHAIIGYDLDKQKMVGTVIDHGPYAASMTGEYDKELKTVQWMTAAKDPMGNPIVQKTLITHRSDKERVLVLMVPGKKKDEFIKFMQIEFVKRK